MHTQAIYCHSISSIYIYFRHQNTQFNPKIYHYTHADIPKSKKKSKLKVQTTIDAKHLDKGCSSCANMSIYTKLSPKA